MWGSENQQVVVKEDLNILYETNYAEWARENADLLRQRRFSELDVEHLIEELSDMGRSERNELESRLLILIAHLLKWQFQYSQLSDRWREFTGTSWRNTIIEQRKRLHRRLKKSPGLKAHLLDAVADVYSDAAELAAEATGLSVSSFPDACPYSISQLLDSKFWPKTDYRK